MIMSDSWLADEYAFSGFRIIHSRSRRLAAVSVSAGKGITITSICHTHYT